MRHLCELDAVEVSRSTYRKIITEMLLISECSTIHTIVGSEVTLEILMSLN